MSRVIDLTTHGRGGGSSEPLKHPAGVTLPFDGPSDAALIIPEIRSEIRSGAYDADMIALLDATVAPGDRVLVIGAGLGVLTTLIATRHGVERIIAVEANTSLVPYLERTLALNGAEGVEAVNAVLAEGKKGRVPFFARRDIRTSSLLPHDRSWQQVMMVPFMDLNLILAEEHINLVVSEIPVASAELLARAELGPIERILLNAADDPSAAWADGGVCARLVARGYVPEASGSAVLFRRADALDTRPEAPGTAEPGEARAASPGGPPTPGRAQAAREGEGDDGERDDDEGDDDEGDEDEASGGEDAEAGGVSDEDTATPTPPPRRAEAGAGEPRRGAPAVAPEMPAAPAAPPGPEAGEKRPAAGPAATNGGRSPLLWGVLAVALLLALPLILFGEFAAERGGTRSAAVQRIVATWGGPQTLVGPFLLVPVRDTAGGAAEPLVILPRTLEVLTGLDTETRREGAFEAPVYRSESEMRLAADPGAAARLIGAGETALWAETVLALGVSDPSALGGADLLGGAAERAGFEPGSGVAGLPGIRARVGDPRAGGAEWGLSLEVKGSGALRLTPAGGATLWRLHADWPHPDFTGSFPPRLREIGAAGFVAEWRVPQVAHALPRAFRGTGPIATLGEAAFGVELAQPVDLYRTAERAAKFGLLVIVLTFGAIFLIERSAGRRARVAHYALVGGTQCAFFLLLLALAELIGFGPAYAVASVATVALLSAYAWAGLGLGPRAGWMTLALALLYGVMYPILRAEEHALLMGAVLAFLVIAALMWGTSARARPGDGGK